MEMVGVSLQANEGRVDLSNWDLNVAVLDVVITMVLTKPVFPQVITLMVIEVLLNLIKDASIELEIFHSGFVLLIDHVAEIIVFPEDELIVVVSHLVGMLVSCLGRADESVANNHAHPCVGDLSSNLEVLVNSSLDLFLGASLLDAVLNDFVDGVGDAIEVWGKEVLVDVLNSGVVEVVAVSNWDLAGELLCFLDGGLSWLLLSQFDGLGVGGESGESKNGAESLHCFV